MRNQEESYGEFSREVREKANAKAVQIIPELMEVYKASKDCLEWLNWWLEENLCECEGGHICGYMERSKERDRLHKAIVNLENKEVKLKDE